MPRFIPPELTDMIIGQVGQFGELDGLRSCSLVCREWVPASQVQHLCRIKIDGSASHDHFDSLRRARDGISRSDWSARNLGAYARAVHIVAGSGRRWSLLRGFLEYLLPKLNRMEELRIDRGKMTIYDPTMDAILKFLGKSPVPLVHLCVNIEDCQDTEQRDMIETVLEEVVKTGTTSLKIDIISSSDPFRIQSPANVAHFSGTWTDTRTRTTSPIQM